MRKLTTQEIERLHEIESEYGIQLEQFDDCDRQGIYFVFNAPKQNFSESSIYDSLCHLFPDETVYLVYEPFISKYDQGLLQLVERTRAEIQ